MRILRLAQRLVALTAAVLGSVLASTAGAAPAETAPPSYTLEFWRETEGLQHSRIRRVLQTRDGYLWLGTFGGLVRFDGVRFVSFGVHTGSLIDNEVWALAEDRDGALWIGTITGGLTRCVQGQFTTFLRKDGLPDDVVREIDFDRNGTLWIATPRGVARREGNTFRTFNTKHGLAHASITRLCASAADGVFAIAGDRLHRFNGEGFESADALLAPGDGRPLSLAAGRDGALWICCEGGTVRRVLGSSVTSFTLEQQLGARSAFIYEDPHGTVWLGARDGLRRLEGNVFRLFQPHGANASLRGIMGLGSDREGSLWIGLETNGLAQLRRTQLQTVGEEDGLTDTSLRAVYQGSNDDIWLGTASGFARWRGGTITNFTSRDGVAIPSVNSFAEDAAGALWIAAGGELLQFADERLKAVPGWKRTSDIKAVYRDPANRMWVTTDGDGLFLLDGAVRRQWRARDGLASDHLRGITRDRQGALWITTFAAGVSRFSDGRFTNFTTREGLGSDRVVAVHEHRDGTLWFATRGGITRLRDGRWRNFTAREGLPTNLVSGIVEDEGGRLWFSCEQGIFSLAPSDFEALATGRIARVDPVVYDVKDGMRTAGFVAGQQPSAWRTRDGRLLFPSLRGLVVVDPLQIKANPVPPPVHIERVVINDRVWPVSRRAVIQPGAGRVQIDYTALSLIAPEKVHFRYRLEGFDAAWIEAESRRYAFYASLPAGDYTFRVMACNNDGVWSDAGATFSFTLRPFFYQTTWFYAACALVLVVSPGLIYRLRVLRLEARERKLQARIAEEIGKVRVLRGMLPICASCKQVRDDKGYWNQIEVYIRNHSDTQFSHGICPDCMRKLYPEIAEEVLDPPPAPPTNGPAGN